MLNQLYSYLYNFKAPIYQYVCINSGFHSHCLRFQLCFNLQELAFQLLFDFIYKVVDTFSAI